MEEGLKRKAIQQFTSSLFEYFMFYKFVMYCYAQMIVLHHKPVTLFIVMMLVDD
jgi:hypothetical protein